MGSLSQISVIFVVLCTTAILSHSSSQGLEHKRSRDQQIWSINDKDVVAMNPLTHSHRKRSIDMRKSDRYNELLEAGDAGKVTLTKRSDVRDWKFNRLKRDLHDQPNPQDERPLNSHEQASSPLEAPEGHEPETRKARQITQTEQQQQQPNDEKSTQKRLTANSVTKGRQVLPFPFPPPGPMPPPPIPFWEPLPLPEPFPPGMVPMMLFPPDAPIPFPPPGPLGPPLPPPVPSGTQPPEPPPLDTTKYNPNKIIDTGTNPFHFHVPLLHETPRPQPPFEEMLAVARKYKSPLEFDLVMQGVPRPPEPINVDALSPEEFRAALMTLLQTAPNEPIRFQREPQGQQGQGHPEEVEDLTLFPELLPQGGSARPTGPQNFDQGLRNSRQSILTSSGSQVNNPHFEFSPGTKEALEALVGDQDDLKLLSLRRMERQGQGDTQTQNSEGGNAGPLSMTIPLTQFPEMEESESSGHRWKRNGESSHEVTAPIHPLHGSHREHSRRRKRAMETENLEIQAHSLRRTKREALNWLKRILKGRPTTSDEQQFIQSHNEATDQLTYKVQHLHGSDQLERSKHHDPYGWSQVLKDGLPVTTQPPSSLFPKVPYPPEPLNPKILGHSKEHFHKNRVNLQKEGDEDIGNANGQDNSWNSLSRHTYEKRVSFKDRPSTRGSNEVDTYTDDLLPKYLRTSSYLNRTHQVPIPRQSHHHGRGRHLDQWTPANPSSMMDSTQRTKRSVSRRSKKSNSRSQGINPLSKDEMKLLHEMMVNIGCKKCLGLDMKILEDTERAVLDIIEDSNASATPFSSTANPRVSLLLEQILNCSAGVTPEDQHDHEPNPENWIDPYYNSKPATTQVMTFAQFNPFVSPNDVEQGEPVHRSKRQRRGRRSLEAELLEEDDEVNPWNQDESSIRGPSSSTLTLKNELESFEGLLVHVVLKYCRNVQPSLLNLAGQYIFKSIHEAKVPTSGLTEPPQKGPFSSPWISVSRLTKIILQLTACESMTSQQPIIPEPLNFESSGSEGQGNRKRQVNTKGQELSSSGGEELDIPILSDLEQKYLVPNNWLRQWGL